MNGIPVELYTLGKGAKNTLQRLKFTDKALKNAISQFLPTTQSVPDMHLVDCQTSLLFGRNRKSIRQHARTLGSKANHMSCLEADWCTKWIQMVPQESTGIHRNPHDTNTRNTSAVRCYLVLSSAHKEILAQAELRTVPWSTDLGERVSHVRNIR